MLGSPPNEETDVVVISNRLCNDIETSWKPTIILDIIHLHDM